MKFPFDMMFFVSTVATVACIANVASADVFRLPINRTTIGWDFRFVGPNRKAEAHQLPFGAQDQRKRRVLRSRNREQANVGHHQEQLERVHIPVGPVRSTGHHSDDEVIFWSLFTTPISIGKPPLNLTALIDTSWSSFFIPSANCTLNPKERSSCLVHAPLYNSTKSSTYRADLRPGKLLYHSYNGVYTWGIISQDDLHVANMEIRNQVFEEALEWHPMWFTRDDYFDTALGLSLHQTPESWGNFSAQSPFQNMVQQNLLDENIFTLKLPRNDNETGELVLGGVPEILTRDKMIQIPLNHTRDGGGDEWWDFYTSSGWQVSTQRISMDSPNGSIPVLTAEHTAIVSSSYPYIALPDDAATIANHAIGLEELYDWVECETRPQLPNMTLGLGAGAPSITLSPWDYLIEVYDDLFQQLKCVSAFQSMEWRGEMGFIMLGAPFLSGVWSVWDKDGESISFANRAL
ncbi:aspartic peptidase domain-containing protein [Lophiotrema nucula]|uniref:Aspartic peptidase domain-containing protein n=1 Tax=Lophiotrema nucula TaxID=690887 RepID=A0A6A5ZBG5_9PLEO|nr:aspartic peptidase domain-containing protein [Lophiotrema nucula]